MNARNRIIAAIGLIASCISIFVFCTGLSNAWEVLRLARSTEPSFQSGPISTDTASPLISKTTPTSTKALPLTPTSTPTLTPTPMETQLVETGENYKIEQIPNGETAAELVLQVPKGFPLDRQVFELHPVVKDIAGGWQPFVGDWSFGPPHSQHSFSPEGVLRYTDLTPEGYWIFTQSGYFYSNFLNGWWGNSGRLSYLYYGMVFPVRKGSTTRVTIKIGRLEIGVLDSQNNTAVTGQIVEIYGQSKDIAGNIVEATDCDNYDPSVRTDATGVATFYLGPGTYFVAMTLLDGRGTQKRYDNIQLSAGEQKRMTVNFP